MGPLATSFVVFVLVFAGAPLGMALRRALPEEHFGTDAKDTVRLAIGLIVTMTGLVLGMLVSSAKTYLDSQKNVIAQMATEVVTLDNLLTLYGPEAKQTRIEVRRFVEEAIDRIWPKKKSEEFQLRPKSNEGDIYAELQKLVPKNDIQVAAKAQITSLIIDLKRTYWLMFLESEQTSMSFPLLVVVVSWLIAIFISFGAFAPSNSTVMVTLLICAMAVSAAIFIIMEMYSPFSGMLKISPVAVRDALHQMAADR
ncbi:MAG TPA: hypothetical protein VK684_03425 [Edaphobacter sp.]|jgi:hypothetical protein|nr:hypothetical protein [Edaphobacter sp.]